MAVVLNFRKRTRAKSTLALGAKASNLAPAQIIHFPGIQKVQAEEAAPKNTTGRPKKDS